MERKLLMLIMTMTLFGLSVPAFAADRVITSDPKVEECAKECEMLLRNCANEVDTIQERILKLQARIKKEKAISASPEKIRKLEQKLRDANETLNSIEYGR